MQSTVAVPFGAGDRREVFLRRVTRWQAERDRENLADLHVAAYTTHSGNDFGARLTFLDRLVRDTQEPGFDLVMAEGNTAQGYGYGFRVGRDGAWWDGFVGTLPGALVELTARGGVYALTELMVLPPYRRAGVATKILKELLANCGAILATALVSPDNSMAQSVYRAWGWTVIGQRRPSLGVPPQDVLVQLVPQR
ncbi:GNAT family N-acetyltransferase [Streptomyces daliensis]|uniref:GNAT family N-acetyltransferase n=1 Tax=Streptomyces daliensis TaxID=299421 RepID=A0A8T4J1H0_9ACTN|nr:GNAT family N-acetyltransferase [Streptomyces daliensis]